MKIGLVTPYIFPLPGGVNAHVGYLYENLVKRGHDVRIISSTHGPQRSSEGDIIRLGYGWSVPTNGSIGTLTVSHRYGQLVTEMLDRERFDIIHFHEPFVPFLSLQILRHSRAVNIATFHAYSGFSPSYEFGQRMMKRFARRLHGRIAVSAAARHFIGRYFPGEYKVIPNGVDLAQFEGVPPFARWRDGIPNILFVGRFESRKGLMYLLRAYYQLRLEGLGCRLLVVGHGPQLGEVRRYIASRRLGGVELLGRLSEHDKARAFATADIYASPATGQESFGIVLLEAMAAGRAHRLQRHPRLQGRRAAQRAGRARAAPRRRGPRGRARHPAARPPSAPAHGRVGSRAGRSSSAGRPSPPRSRTTTASSSVASRPPRPCRPASMRTSRRLRAGPCRRRVSGPARRSPSGRGRGQRSRGAAGEGPLASAAGEPGRTREPRLSGLAAARLDRAPWSRHPSATASSATPMTKTTVTTPTTRVPASTTPPTMAGSVLTANWKSQFQVGSRPW